MLFQTLPFLIFFAVVYSVYLLVKGTRLRLPWLLVSSYVFYAWLSPLYLIPLAYATVVDYFIAGRIEVSPRKRAWLALSIANNVAVLGFFKYAGFFAENVNWLLSAAKAPYAIPAPSFLLPAGLSFFLLQSIGYTIDVYRGTTKREKNFLAYATFVAFFPRLLAGPIERANHLLPQFHGEGRVTLQDFTDGLSIFAVGYFKKVALADYLAIYVAQVYGSPEQHQAPGAAAGDVPVRLADLLRFQRLHGHGPRHRPDDGHRPDAELQQPLSGGQHGRLLEAVAHQPVVLVPRLRVHPAGRQSQGQVRHLSEPVLTMVLSGLWHGAAWTFVLWGAVHALGNFATRELERTPFYVRRLPTIVKQLFVFALVTFAWIFFRAATIGDAWTIVTRIFTSGLSDPKCPLLAIGLIAAVWIYQYLFESRLRSILEIRLVRIVLMILLLTYLVLTVPAEGQPFIYMQF